MAADLAGGSGSDTLIGAGGDDLIFGDGYEGLFRLYDLGLGLFDRGTTFWTTSLSQAQGAADSISAGDGNNTVWGGGGNDTIRA